MRRTVHMRSIITHAIHISNIDFLLVNSQFLYIEIF